MEKWLDTEDIQIEFSDNLTVNTPYILIIEDQTDSRKILKKVLESWGYKVVSISSGKPAIDYSKENKPLLIISDIAMPEMGGHEILYRFRNDPELKDIPFMFCSGYEQDSNVELKPDAYLRKPFDFDMIEATVKKLIKK